MNRTLVLFFLNANVYVLNENNDDEALNKSTVKWNQLSKSISARVLLHHNIWVDKWTHDYSKKIKRNKFQNNVIEKLIHSKLQFPWRNHKLESEYANSNSDLYRKLCFKMLHCANAFIGHKIVRFLCLAFTLKLLYI